MRRVGLGLLFLALVLAGVLAAAVLAASSPRSAATISTSTETTASTETSSVPTTTSATTTTSAATTTSATTTAPTTTIAPPPKPKPVVIPSGVTVGGIHVGGLSPAVAYEVVRTAFASPLVLVLGSRRTELSPRDLGAVAYVKAAVARAVAAAPGTAVRLFVGTHGGAVRELIAQLAGEFDRSAVDARVFLRSLTPFVTKSAWGRKVDRRAALTAILAALRANKRTPLKLPVRPVRPAVGWRSFGPVIVIRRESKRLFVYDGMRLWHVFPVATGQATYPTPLGRFNIVVKWRNPWWYPPNSPWAKGLKPVPPGPGNPLGTRWMGLSAPGVGIHGTPDEASVGYSASHGCIRMYVPDAERVFGHVEIGTPVFIVAA